MLRPLRETSYPYLWIARHYGVPYRDVLAHTEAKSSDPAVEWQIAVWRITNGLCRAEPSLQRLQ